MSVSEVLDQYIQEVGKGSVRDALNIALAEKALLQRELDSIKETQSNTTCPDHGVDYIIYCPVDGCRQPT